MATTKLKQQPGYEGHGESSSAPTVRKGKLYAVGTYIDSGQMSSCYPKGTSPNVKTGTSSGQEQ